MVVVVLQHLKCKESRNGEDVPTAVAIAKLLYVDNYERVITFLQSQRVVCHSQHQAKILHQAVAMMMWCKRHASSRSAVCRSRPVPLYPSAQMGDIITLVVAPVLRDGMQFESYRILLWCLQQDFGVSFLSFEDREKDGESRLQRPPPAMRHHRIA